MRKISMSSNNFTWIFQRSQIFKNSQLFDPFCIVQSKVQQGFVYLWQYKYILNDNIRDMGFLNYGKI